MLQLQGAKRPRESEGGQGDEANSREVRVRRTSDACSDGPARINSGLPVAPSSTTGMAHLPACVSACGTPWSACEQGLQPPRASRSSAALCKPSSGPGEGAFGPHSVVAPFASGSLSELHSRLRALDSVEKQLVAAVRSSRTQYLQRLASLQADAPRPQPHNATQLVPRFPRPMAGSMPAPPPPPRLPLQLQTRAAPAGRPVAAFHAVPPYAPPMNGPMRTAVGAAAAIHAPLKVDHPAPPSTPLKLAPGPPIGMPKSAGAGLQALVEAAEVVTGRSALAAPSTDAVARLAALLKSPSQWQAAGRQVV